MQLTKSPAATKIQSLYRKYICKSLYNQKQHGLVKIQSIMRQHIARKKYLDLYHEEPL